MNRFKFLLMVFLLSVSAQAFGDERTNLVNLLEQAVNELVSNPPPELLPGSEVHYRKALDEIRKELNPESGFDRFPEQVHFSFAPFSVLREYIRNHRARLVSQFSPVSISLELITEEDRVSVFGCILTGEFTEKYYQQKLSKNLMRGDRSGFRSEDWNDRKGKSRAFDWLGPEIQNPEPNLPKVYFYIY